MKMGYENGDIIWKAYTQEFHRLGLWPPAKLGPIPKKKVTFRLTWTIEYSFKKQFEYSFTLW